MLTEAYSTLSDATKRREYDNKRSSAAWGRARKADTGRGFADKYADRAPRGGRNPFARADGFNWEGFGARDAGFGFGGETNRRRGRWPG